MSKKNQHPHNSETIKPNEPVQKYVRLINVTQPQDMLPAWQPEIVIISGDRVISREKQGPRDVWAMAFARAQDLIDPRNEQ